MFCALIKKIKQKFYMPYKSFTERFVNGVFIVVTRPMFCEHSYYSKLFMSLRMYGPMLVSCSLIPNFFRISWLMM